MTTAEDVILRAGEVAVAVTAILTLLALLANKLVVKPLTQQVLDTIDERTRPIQANANGGWSLPDSIKILRRLEDRQTDIGDRLARIEGALEAHLTWHGN